jgi:hypothetical protein
MSDTLAARLTALQTLSLDELKQRWAALYGKPAPDLAPDMLVRAIAYKLQEQTTGGLNPATIRKLRRIAAELRQDHQSDLPPPPARLAAGVQLLREWNGETQVVEVLATGFAWRGQTYASLSSVARAITGARWSGPRFFGLSAGENKSAPAEVRNGGAA